MEKRPGRTYLGVGILTLFFALIAATAFAAHPLITDDAGTQGKGKFQLEVNAEYANDSGNAETALGATLSAGLSDHVDLIFNSPFLFVREKDDIGDWNSENGISDLALALKWRFYEHEGLSFALKPGITIPTGNADKGLGEGKAAYSFFFITTKEMDPFTLHLNLGYILNRPELRNIFHCSVAGEYAVSKSLKIVGNFGGETNPDRDSNVNPLFVLGGMIFGVNEKIDVDFGVKAGLNKAEADYSLLTGITYRF